MILSTELVPEPAVLSAGRIAPNGLRSLWTLGQGAVAVNIEIEDVNSVRRNGVRGVPQFLVKIINQGQRGAAPLAVRLLAIITMSPPFAWFTNQLIAVGEFGFVGFCNIVASSPPPSRSSPP